MKSILLAILTILTVTTSLSATAFADRDDDRGGRWEHGHDRGRHNGWYKHHWWDRDDRVVYERPVVYQRPVVVDTPVVYERPVVYEPPRPGVTVTGCIPSPGLTVCVNGSSY